MKPEELRIGNWVHWSGPAGSEKGLISGIAKEEVSFSCGDYGMMQDLYGIPITEEWLEKFGLNKPSNEKAYHFEKDNVEYLWSEFSGGIKVFRGDIPWTTYPCKYVHQLQNLYFSLTGEEL